MERNRLVVSKLTQGIWQILTWALEIIEKFYFAWLLLSKVYIASTEIVQRSYVSWNWRGMQNLERNWLVVSKLTERIWQILKWALESLKNFRINGLLLSKVKIVWAEKYRKVILHETKEVYKIWRETDLSFQNWHI